MLDFANKLYHDLHSQYRLQGASFAIAPEAQARSIYAASTRIHILPFCNLSNGFILLSHALPRGCSTLPQLQLIKFRSSNMFCLMATKNTCYDCK